MTRSTTIIILLFYCLSTLWAQEPPIIDSLKTLYAQSTDTTKVDLAFSIGKFYIVYNLSLDSVERYTTTGLRLCDELDCDKQDRGYFLLGQMYRQQNKYGEALQNFQKAHDLLKAHGNQRGVIAAISAIGVIYWDIGDLDRAMQQYIKAIEIGESTGEIAQIDGTYSNVGSILRQMGSFEEAIAYFHKSMEISQQNKNQDDETKITLITTMLNCANTFMNLEQLDSAQFYLDRAIERSEEVGFQQGVLRAWSHQVNLAFREKQYESVIQTANRILDAANQSNSRDDQLLLISYRYLAKAYAHLGNREAAQRNVDAALQLATDIRPMRYDALETAIYVNKYFGNFAKTVELQEQYLEVHDSILDAQKQHSIQALQSLYETEKKERELAQLTQQNEAQAFQLQRRTTLIIGIALVALFALLALYFYSQQRILREKQNFYEAEQRLLRLQMNPHFLFNALSSIQNYLFDRADLQKAIRYLSRFAELMRQVLEYSRETYISLEDEIRTLENYLALQQLRYDHAFDYEIIIGEGINRWETMIPPVMAQPFVENAIEHGKVHLIENGKITVRFDRENDHLILSVEDNGVGRATAQQIETKKKYKSLATRITKDRIQVLKNLSQRDFTFNVVDLPERGTKVIFEFPITQTS